MIYEDAHTPYALLATARTGSRPFFDLTSLYLKKYYAQVPGHELLINLEQKFRINEDRSIRLLDDYDNENGRANRPYDEKLRERFDFVKSSGVLYYLKFFPAMMTEEIREWAFGKFQWLFIERRDLYQQLLSRVISRKTNRWYNLPSLNLESNCLVATRDDLEFFALQLAKYNELKNLLAPESRRVTYYEDFIAQPLETTLENIGFDKPVDLSSFSWTTRQNPADKSSLFKNRSEIAKWYRDSILHEMSPL